MAFAIATATADARAVIEDRVKTTWVTDCGQLETSLQFGNTGIDPPSNAVWMRATLILGEGGTEGAFGRIDTKPALVQFDWFGIKNRGAKALDIFADTFKVAFQRVDAGTIHFYSVDGPREIPDPARSRVTMRVRVQYSELHPS